MNAPLSAPHLPVLETGRPAIRGDLLSCYTASVAWYLRCCGADPDWALGLQLFTAIRIVSENPPTCAFVHYHTPLLGTAPTHYLELRRRWTTSVEEACEAIASECRRSGLAIISGDAYRLPWSVAFGRRHAPHWFVVDFVEPAGRALHVVDTFAYVDDLGTQKPYDGWTTLDVLGIPPALCPAELYRGVWAFGREDPLPPAPAGSIEWFEAAAPAHGIACNPDALLNLLASGCSWYDGSSLRSDLADWLVGVSALFALVAWVGDRLDDRRLYVASDDLWVAYRNRLSFANALGRAAAFAGRPDLHQLAEQVRDVLAPAWSAIPRIMRYNASCLDRGRSPRRLVVDLLRQIAEQEAEFVGRLGKSLT